MLESLESRTLLSASAAAAYREMMMSALGGQAVYMPLSSSSTSTPTVSIYPYNPRNDGGPINIEGRPDEGGFGLRRTGDLTEPLTVNWQITGGTAAGDYTVQAARSSTIPAKKQGIRVPVQAVDDMLVEGDETLIIALTPGDYAVGGPSNAVLILGDDDATPDLSLAGLSESEEETPGAFLAVGADRVALNLKLEPAANLRLGSTAVLSLAAGADKVKVWSAQTGGVLLLNATETSKSWKGLELPSQVWIEATAPSSSPGDIALTLSFYANRSVTAPATDTVKATVVGEVSIEAIDDEAIEYGRNPAIFRVTRTGNLSNSLDVFYSLSGSATLGNVAPDGSPTPSDADYTGADSAAGYLELYRISIPAGASSADIILTPFDDISNEGIETIVVQLESAPQVEGVLGFGPPYMLAADKGAAEGKILELPKFKGFEGDRYQQHDGLIKELVDQLNKNKKEYSGGTDQQAAGIPDLDPLLVKSWLVQETGGGDAVSLAAWAKDPAQVNVPGDWNEWKADVGLQEPVERNTGDLRTNLDAALKYLTRKGFGTSGQPARNRPEGFFDGWKTALQRYNGRTVITENGKPYSENYADRILQRAANPNEHYPIELPKPQ